jgi:O-antigen ligase
VQQTAIDPTPFGANSLLRVRGRRLLDSGMFLALLALIAMTATPWGATQLWWNPIFECIVFALAGIWAIECLFSDSWGLFEQRLVRPIIALVVFAFIQSVPLWSTIEYAALGETVRLSISADPYETRRFALRLLALALALALLFRYTSTRHRYLALVYVVIGVGLANALFVLVPYARAFFGFPGQASLSGWGLFANRNHFAFLMAMVIGLMLGLGLRAGVTWRARLLFLVLIAPLWIALLLTRSRAGLLALASEVLFLVLMFGFIRPSAASFLRKRIGLGESWQVSGLFITKLALAVCFVMALWSSAVWIGGDSLMRRLESVPTEFSLGSRNGSNRMDIWRATWRLFKSNPVLGTGLGAYGVAITEYHDASGKWIPQEAHNDYLELLASGGLIGGGLGLWFIVALIRGACMRLRSNDPFQCAACLGALVGIFAVAVHSLFDFGLHISTNALIFVALVVIATAELKMGKQNFAALA